MPALIARRVKKGMSSLRLVNLKSSDPVSRSAKTTLRFTKVCQIKVIISFKA